MPQDKWFNTGQWPEDEIAQGECAEVRKVQLVEGQIERGINTVVAVQSELSEGVLRGGKDMRGEGLPEVGPAREERPWIRVASKSTDS